MPKKKKKHQIYNYDLLCGEIRKVFISKEKFAKAIGLSTTALQHKLQNKNAFTQDDIEKICKGLSIPRKKILVYFFTLKV